MDFCTLEYKSILALFFDVSIVILNIFMLCIQLVYINLKFKFKFKHLLLIEFV